MFSVEGASRVGFFLWGGDFLSSDVVVIEIQCTGMVPKLSVEGGVGLGSAKTRWKKHDLFYNTLSVNTNTRQT